MKIECILRRDPPAVVTLGATAYQFQPDEQGRHVCDVEDNAHLARLLSISEAYRLPGDAPIPQALIPAIVEQSLPTTAATLAPVDEHLIKGSTVHPATFDLGNNAVTDLDDVVAHALELSGLTTMEWDGLPDEDRHALIDVALDAMDQRDPPTDEYVTGPVTELVTEAKPTTETAPVSVAGNSNGDAPPTAPVDLAAEQAAELESLRAQYLAKFGKAAHHKQHAERLRELLAAPAEKEGE